jgi:hypothetical protein
MLACGADAISRNVPRYMHVLIAAIFTVTFSSCVNILYPIEWQHSSVEEVFP